MPTHQSKIKKLITELCPKGVEYKELGQVADYSKTRIAATELNNQNYVGVDNLLPNKQGKTSSNYVPTTGNLTRFDNGDILLGNIRPYLKKVWRATYFGGTNGDVLVIRINDNIRLSSEFLYYLLSSDSFFNFDMQFAKGAKMPRGNKAAIKKFPIPLPPLPIQKEIVKILDNFTKLEAELEAELEARKKQYKYYRDDLLNIKDVEYKALGEIGEFIRGNGLQKKDFAESGIGCIHYGQIYTYYGTFANKTKTFVSPELAKKLKKAQKGDVLIAGVSENIEDVCKPLGWLGEEICISGDMFAFRHNQDTKFITYLLQTTNFHKYKERYAQGAKVTRVKTSKILDYKIPLPPLTEQERIVAILDKFDALVNDIFIGLPAELKARRQQYEYYREKLLTFKEKI